MRVAHLSIFFISLRSVFLKRDATSFFERCCVFFEETLRLFSSDAASLQKTRCVSSGKAQRVVINQ